MSHILKRALVKKNPFDVQHRELPATFGLVDLICVGIGGTVGTGIFSLTAVVARYYAGPSIVLCWALGGIAALLSGFSYMELSTRFPQGSGTYTFAYMCLGELPAIIGAFLFTLECGLSSSAVARSFASKLVKWLEVSGWGTYNWLSYEYANITAFVLEIMCVLLFWGSIVLGKYTVNFFTTLKMMVVAFLIITALTQFDSQNLQNGFPPPENNAGQFGWSGVILGTTKLFFGYLGFDEVCCLASECQNPRRLMPIALLLTIIGTAVSSGLAGFALVGMQYYANLDPDAGFAVAFQERGMWIESQIAQVGELVNLPLVALVCFLPQPRIQLNLSEDGLLPSWIGKLSKNKNPSVSIVLSGLYCSAFALFLPFGVLNDVISSGVLLSYSMTNVCLLVVRMHSALCNALVYVFVLLGGITACLWNVSNTYSNVVMVVLQYVFLLATVFVLLVLCGLQYKGVPENPDMPAASVYAPLVPLVPLLGILINWWLVFQLSPAGLATLLGYILLAILCWFSYGYKHSIVWAIQKQNMTEEDDESKPLLADK